MRKLSNTEQKGKVEPDKSGVDNPLELTKFAAEVNSRIKEDISSDFVLAKLGEKDKEATKELTNNAYLGKRIVKDIAEQRQYKWNKTKKIWEEKEIEKEEQKKILEIADEVFDIQMIRPTMVAILNRNKQDNPILSGLMNKNTQETKTELDEETIAERIGSKLSKQKKEE